MLPFCIWKICFFSISSIHTIIFSILHHFHFSFSPFSPLASHYSHVHHLFSILLSIDLCSEIAFGSAQALYTLRKATRLILHHLPKTIWWCCFTTCRNHKKRWETSHLFQPKTRLYVFLLLSFPPHLISRQEFVDAYASCWLPPEPFTKPCWTLCLLSEAELHWPKM